jgi:hypothetical protein
MARRHDVTPRRVLKFVNGRVTYISRGKNAASWSEQNSVIDGRFAQDVEQKVACESVSEME